MNYRFALELRIFDCLVLATLMTGGNLRKSVACVGGLWIARMLLTGLVIPSEIVKRSFANATKLLGHTVLAVMWIWTMGITFWKTASPEDVPGMFPERVWSYALFAAVQEIILLECVYKREEQIRRDSVFRTALRLMVWHFPNPILMPLTFVSGCLTAAYYAKHRSMIVPIIWHAATGLAIASYWPHWTMVVGYGFIKNYVWTWTRQSFI